MRRALLLLALLAPAPAGAAGLTHRVYGYWPTWSGTPATFHWDLLSDVAFFSQTMNVDGTLPTASWSTTGKALITEAHGHGVRVHLTVTRFNTGNNNEIHGFLSNPNAVTAGVDAIVQAVKAQGGDGVNLDFEFVAGADKALYTAFVQALAGKLHAQVPGAELSIAMPAIVYPGYDIAALGAAADMLMIMAYDYHWGGSNPGPVSPLVGSMKWGSYSQASTITLYKGLVQPGKLVIGMPLYGYDYYATSNAVPGTKVANTTAKAVLYKNAEVIAPMHGRVWDMESMTPYYLYQDMSGWRQCFYDDAESTGYKIDLATATGVSGVGLWALNYESDTFWTVVKDKLTVAPADMALAADGGAGDGGAADGSLGGNDLATVGTVDLATSGGGDGGGVGEDAAVDPGRIGGGCAVGGRGASGAWWIALVALAAIGGGRGRGGLRRSRPRACRRRGRAP